jgi:hypothetical protein
MLMAGTQWVRVDVGYLRNPKVRRAGRDAALMHLAAIFYLGEHRIDSGLLPPEALAFVAAEAHVRQPGRVIERLVKHGLWHPDLGGGFLIHHYAETNGEASEAAANRYRQQKWRERNA